MFYLDSNFTAFCSHASNWQSVGLSSSNGVAMNDRKPSVTITLVSATKPQWINPQFKLLRSTISRNSITLIYVDNNAGSSYWTARPMEWSSTTQLHQMLSVVAMRLVEVCLLNGRAMVTADTVRLMIWLWYHAMPLWLRLVSIPIVIPLNGWIRYKYSCVPGHQNRWIAWVCVQ